MRKKSLTPDRNGVIWVNCGWKKTKGDKRSQAKFTFAKGKWNDEPQLFLELLRFNEMLLWITQVV